MNTFEGFPPDARCPICNTNEDKECFLIPIQGTGDGQIYEAVPTHVDCVTRNLRRFWLIRNGSKTVIYMMLEQDREP